ncbi:hypothetical protein [Cryptosporangium phraense]|uniref:Uncharacterized protein n=1 Tax=Cryptosporangium phraense TaxID=2593070 RepID=A0A545ATG1_9ACTN|nr:hypothetical protein [Cryptosporangium phraense]TQS44541.1 hypothetical protein FL583_13865 [Cryptosporangium phraense]
MNEISLSEVLSRIDRLRCGEAVALFAPLADELADAHELGAAHRAINAHSIRLGDDGVSFVPSPRARKRPAGVRARAEDVGDLAGVIAGALLGREVDPDGWADRAVALGVPTDLVTVLATALSGRAAQRPTAYELAAALRAACDPVPLDRLLSPARTEGPSPVSGR